MASEQRIYANFSFVDQEKAPEDTFEVVGFEGIEAISEPFRFEIELLSNDPDLDLDNLVGKPAVFEFFRDENLRKIHGVVSLLEQGEEAQFDYYRYKAVLVPRMWFLTLSSQNQIYQEKTVPEIVTSELLNGEYCGDLLNDDLDIRLMGVYPAREYVVQYQESDLNFVDRLMEHEGIYYYFDHLDERDKIVFCDDKSKLDPVLEQNIVPYVPASGMAAYTDEAIHTFSFKQAQIARDILLRDFNYRTPHLTQFQGNAETNELGYGRVCQYGDHFKTLEEGEQYANIRAQMHTCHQKTCQGTSDVIGLEAGKLFELTEHFRESLNGEYLITRIHHVGGQAMAGVSGQGQTGESIAYQNSFDAIPYDIEFRPNLKTPKPKLYGILNATIDGEADTDRAQIDDQGRYKIKLPFDIGGAGEGKASRWVRKAEPYGGQGTGMSFPLLKGSEVIWSCINGDPDRPIITGVVPNPHNQSVVTSTNSTDNVIKTPSGIVMQMRDGSATTQQEEHAETEQSRTKIFNQAESTDFSLPPEVVITHLVQEQHHTSNEISITSVAPDQELESGESFSYQVSASATYTGADLRYQLVNPPAGMTINRRGLISWTAGNLGHYPVTVRVTDVAATPNRTEDQDFTLTVSPVDNQVNKVVVTDNPETSSDETQKSYSIKLPHYRTGAGNTQQSSYSRIGSFHIDELADFDNVYYRPGTFDSTTGLPLEGGAQLRTSIEDASDGNHKIMDVLNATRSTYSIDNSTKSASGLYESLDPHRFGLMEYTDGAKLMVHWNGCFDLAAGTSLTYDSLGYRDSLISVVLGEDGETAGTGEGDTGYTAGQAKMIKSERFHKTDTPTGKQWVTETWENVNSYTYNYGVQHNMFIGSTWDYKAAASFEALLGGGTECSLAAKSSFCAGVSTEVKLAAEINYSNGYAFDYSAGDSIDIKGGDNTIKGSSVILQYEPSAVTKPGAYAATAAVASTFAALGTAVSGVGVAISASNKGNIKDGAHVNFAAANVANLAGLAVGVSGLAAFKASKAATKASIAAPPAPAPFPYVKVEQSKLTLHCGAASIVMEANGQIAIKGANICVETTTGQKINLAPTQTSFLHSSDNGVILGPAAAQFGFGANGIDVTASTLGAVGTTFNVN